jgi:hypothetical protein
LHNNPVRGSQIGIPIISQEIVYKIGALVEGLEANTAIVTKLVESIGRLELSQNSMSHDFARLRSDLEKANVDLMKIDKTLSSIGIDDETKKDLQYLRLLRQAHDERGPIIRSVTTAVIIAIVLGLLAYAWTALQNQAKNEIKTISQAQK